MNKNDPNPFGLMTLPFNSKEKRIKSSDLFGSGNSVLIDHRGVYYTLRITQLGKLILTK